MKRFVCLKVCIHVMCLLKLCDCTSSVIVVNVVQWDFRLHKRRTDNQILKNTNIFSYQRSTDIESYFFNQKKIQNKKSTFQRRILYTKHTFKRARKTGLQPRNKKQIMHLNSLLKICETMKLLELKKIFLESKEWQKFCELFENYRTVPIPV
jgi:hypothetical protein